MVELVILDLYGTIWGSDKPPRNGLIDFLDMYWDRKFVVATDDPDKKSFSSKTSFPLLSFISLLIISASLSGKNGITS